MLSEQLPPTLTETLHYYVLTDWLPRQLGQRSKSERNTLGLLTGKPGRGKSWAGLRLCRTMQGPSWDPELQIVFNGKQFKLAMEKSPVDSWTLWDEPKGLSHRDWYKEINRAVTSYLQTFRFRKKNVVFAIPKAELLDKSARLVMTFEGIFWNRGIASVYSLEPNMFGSTPEIFKNLIGEAQFGRPDPADIEVYNRKREDFHRIEFPPEAFEEGLVVETPEAKRNKRFKEVYDMVKAQPSKFLDERKGRITARKISSLALCSDQLARKVYDRFLLETHISPQDPGKGVVLA